MRRLAFLFPRVFSRARFSANSGSTNSCKLVDVELYNSELQELHKSSQAVKNSVNICPPNSVISHTSQNVPSAIIIPRYGGRPSVTDSH